jgi:hypothetical protein
MMQKMIYEILKRTYGDKEETVNTFVVNEAKRWQSEGMNGKVNRILFD